MEGIIIQYLESQARLDPCFKEKFNPEHIDGCIKYLYKQAEYIAKQTKQKNMIAIKDETAFHWAREYFDEGINIKEEEERIAKEKKAEELSKREQEETAETNNSNLDAQIEESRKKAEEYEQKKKEEERYKREHANGQITIFDILG